MPGRSARIAALSLSASLALVLGCARPNARVELADGDHQPPTIPAGNAPAHVGDDGRRPHIERTRLTASVSSLGDMLDAAEQIYAQWVPPEPGAPPFDAQTFLDVQFVQWGFAPTWFSNVDIDGLHTLDVAVPHDDQIGVSDADLVIAASISARNPTALIEGFPADGRPEPIEAGLWQLVEGDGPRVLFRARADVLEAATSFELLDSLAATRQSLQSGPHLRMTASNFEDDKNIQLRALLDARGVSPAKQDEIVDAAELELTVDFGQDRDFVARTAIVAPFGEKLLGGPPLRDPSTLAKLLPPGAWFVLVQSWSTSTAPLDIDALELSPQATAVLKDLLIHASAVIETIGSETAIAAYVDRKGRATVVLLSEVNDEAAAKAAMRGLFGWVESSAATLGPNLRATVKPDAYRSGKATTDLLSVELPEDARDVLDGMPWLLGTGTKPTLDFTATVHAGKLVLALGPGHRDSLKLLAPRLSGSADAGLEQGGGLAQARALTNGCQVCVAIDPVAVADGLLAILAANPDSDRAFRKLIDSTRKRLLGLKLDGELSFAAGFDAQRWGFAVGVPRSLLVLDATAAKQILESFTTVADHYARIGAPSNEAVCKHVMQVMQREMGSAATQPTADDIEKFLQKCVEDLDKERRKIGESQYRRQAKCVVEAQRMDEMMKCDTL